MLWYIAFAFVYLVVLAALLVFIAGASGLPKHGEIEGSIKPHRKTKARLHIRKDYRDAA